MDPDVVHLQSIRLQYTIHAAYCYNLRAYIETRNELNLFR